MNRDTYYNIIKDNEKNTGKIKKEIINGIITLYKSHEDLKKYILVTTTLTGDIEFPFTIEHYVVDFLFTKIGLKLLERALKYTIAYDFIKVVN